ncbi:hypothetical protein EAI_13954, partial [Harpegnathos saltator]
FSHLKAVVYLVLIDNEQQLLQRKEDGCRTTCNIPRMFERIRQSMMRRILNCIISRGGHYKHLL